MIDLVFEWDPEKEQDNIAEHGVGFEAAERIFFDYFRMERHDDDSSDYEERWQTMGFYDDVLFVVYTERGETIRIISARVAEPFERRIYHGNSQAYGWQRVNP
ncbi:MAG: BrnT family toxin [Treponema sp.]|nr:BrnT family toxin [Treponema sp.]